MRVEAISSDADEACERFVLEQPYSLLYHSSKFRAFLKELLGCEDASLVAFDETGVRGVLPMMYCEVGGRRVHNSMPYYGSNGGIITDSAEAYTGLEDAYNRIATSVSTIASTVISNPLETQREYRFAHTHKDFRIGQLTELSPEDSEIGNLLNRVDSSARRNVKKATGSGITVDMDTNALELLYEIHRSNMAVIGGAAKSKDFFQIVRSLFTPDKDYALYIARKDGEVVAGLLVFYFNRTVEYYTPAVREDCRAAQPLALILATAMSDAARRGFRWWNWGGTWESQTGVYRFKKKWASVEYRYSYFSQINDMSVLDRSREELLNMYRGFYVVPFDALRKKGA